MTLVAPSQAYDHDPVAFARPAARLDESSLMRELDVLVAHDQARFAFLLEVSLDGLWMWDLETPDRGWMSPRFWERLGYDPHDHAQRAADWGRLMHPDASRAAVARFEAFCAQPDHMYDEVLRYRHRDGSSVWLRCRGMAVRNAGGRAIRLLGAHNDITALKHTEAELLQGRAELIQLLDQSSAANAWLELAEQIGRIGHWRHSLADEALIWSSEMYRIHGVDRHPSRPLHAESAKCRGLCPPRRPGQNPRDRRRRDTRRHAVRVCSAPSPPGRTGAPCAVPW
jgi:PAS domain S-box-containing protein